MSAARKVAAVASGGLVPLYETWKAGHSPLTEQQLRTAFRNLPANLASQYLRPLNKAMREAAITTPARAAAFLAQLGHESGELRYWEELASGDAYEGRLDIGNTQPGDGRRYKGRGPIQLTGRDNYREAGKALGVDLEGKPHLAATTETGFRVAAWFWRTRGLNALADAGTDRAFEMITKAINGGLNGYAHRRALWAQAQRALGMKEEG